MNKDLYKKRSEGTPKTKVHRSIRYNSNASFAWKKWGTPYLPPFPAPNYTPVTTMMIMKMVVCSLYATVEYIPESELSIWRPERRIRDAGVMPGVLCHRSDVCGRRLRLERQLVLAAHQRGGSARRYHSLAKRLNSIPSEQELHYRFVSEHPRMRRGTVFGLVCPCVCLS